MGHHAARRAPTDDTFGDFDTPSESPIRFAEYSIEIDIGCAAHSTWYTAMPGEKVGYRHVFSENAWR